MCERHDCDRTVNWLLERVISSARGDGQVRLEVEPEGRVWLGRLTAQQAVVNSPFADRLDRLVPSVIGIRLRPLNSPPWESNVHFSVSAWSRTRVNGQTIWQKTPHALEQIQVRVPSDAI